ncbi:MAG: hypothetical protein OXB95_12765 [Rhodobacteraceae bacterium]|nr:hypothetical protein [Paracoccaceae bacterium]
MNVLSNLGLLMQFPLLPRLNYHLRWFSFKSRSSNQAALNMAGMAKYGELAVVAEHLQMSVQQAP